MRLKSGIDHFLGFETFMEAGRYGSILHNSVDKQAWANRLIVERSEHRGHLMISRTRRCRPIVEREKSRKLLFFRSGALDLRAAKCLMDFERARLAAEYNVLLLSAISDMYDRAELDRRLRAVLKQKHQRH